MSIRPINPDDISVLADLHRASRQISEEGIIRDADLDRDDLARFQSLWQGWMSDETIYKLCEEDNGVIRGFCLYGRVKTRPAFDRGVVPKFGAELYAIYVHPDYIQQGIGKALFRAVLEDLADKKLFGMVLWVLKRNERAVMFYDRFKGEKIGKQRVDIGQTSWAEETCFAWRDIRKLLG